MTGIAARSPPRVGLIPCSTPKPIHELRSIVIRESPALVIGGPDENGRREHLVDWAAYICEYGKSMDLRIDPGMVVYHAKVFADAALLFVLAVWPLARAHA